ncbi:PQQ-dependent dehydrogenase, methanol/ethanol family [Sphingobium sufflavum]|uniref:PQQ-dependent dehydrogenase, methanol/ethanol family n=1 Tax=Sphingobium sufflavum TaxID=1129547 RepID=UPI001F35AA2E|nr:PQQ-dependent dehydrogenase, methanol/ethanol family [Sphingobium sufflavum]MCE7796322.1 PQQ-dependent dehydrogenase, methanol/ethanol family [Sphingobium sufflavum]
MRQARWIRLGCALALASSGAAIVAQQPGPAARPAPTGGTGADWRNVGGSADESGFSQLGQISTATIGKLGLQWALELEGEVSLEATPLAVDGVLYFSGSYGAVYAVDGVTGKQLWRYDPEIWKTGRMGFGMGVNRGVAYDNGRVFIGALDGRLIALNAKTGAVEWSVNTLPGGMSFYSLTGAPRTFKGKVIIGNGGADIGQRGYVTAYDQATGQQAWRFYTAPGTPEQNKGDPVMEMAAKTWSGEWWKVGTGGTAWNGMTFDPEMNRIYIGTGNGGPYDVAKRNPAGGDNLFLASIVALDADTGKYVWHYQQNPNEGWDYKSVQNMISTTIPIDGKPRKVLMQLPTNGFFYVLDRETGKLISAEKVGKVNWASHIDLKTGRPVEMPGIHYQDGPVVLYPSTIGSHNWQAMSYSPKTGLVYIPYMKVAGRYAKLGPGGGGFAIVGTDISFVKNDPDDNTGALVAWDPVTQKQRWKMPRPFAWNGGTLATEGNLVFQGTADGWFRAHDALTGKQLWQFNAGLGIIGAPMSYSAGGKQYVSVLVGWGGTVAAAASALNVGWKYGQQPRRLLTFALGGKQKLPASPPRDMVVHAVDDPAIVLDEKDVTAGYAVGAACASCHGVNFHSGGAPGPDLRESQLALSEDALYEVLHEGALQQRGMPKYPFSRAQVHQIWSAIRAAARESLGARKPTQPVGGARM